MLAASPSLTASSVVCYSEQPKEKAVKTGMTQPEDRLNAYRKQGRAAGMYLIRASGVAPIVHEWL